MNDPYRPLTATQVLDLYFIENRSRVLDIASFLDRIDRYAGADEARAEYRYQAFIRTLRLLVESPGERTRAIQRQRRHDVIFIAGMDLTKGGAHPRAFDLEATNGLSPFNALRGCFISGGSGVEDR